jgi:hypothetical protein
VVPSWPLVSLLLWPSSASPGKPPKKARNNKKAHRVGKKKAPCIYTFSFLWHSFSWFGPGSAGTLPPLGHAIKNFRGLCLFSLSLPLPLSISIWSYFLFCASISLIFPDIIVSTVTTHFEGRSFLLQVIFCLISTYISYHIMINLSIQCCEFPISESCFLPFQDSWKSTWQCDQEGILDLISGMDVHDVGFQGGFSPPKQFHHCTF